MGIYSIIQVVHWFVLTTKRLYKELKFFSAAIKDRLFNFKIKVVRTYNFIKYKDDNIHKKRSSETVGRTNINSCRMSELNNQNGNV